MKKLLIYLFPALFLFYLMFLLGVHYGRTNDEVIRIQENDHIVSSGAVVNGKMDVNRVTVTQLCYIPGIGEVTAQKIIDYRDANGPYQSLDELLNVDGIGPKKLEELSVYLTVGGNYENTGY